MTDELLIRETTLADVPELARIRTASYAWFTASVAAQENWFQTVPEASRALRLLAEHEGRVVGFGMANLNLQTSVPNTGALTLVVDPDFRRRGTGSALHSRLEEHLRDIGATRVHAWANDDEATLAFARDRGFTLGAKDRFSQLDTRALPPMPELPPGVTLISLTEAGPRAVYDLDQAASIDEPGDVSYDGTPYDLWLKRYWGSPDQQHHVGTVAVVDGVPACATFMEADQATGRGTSTGTCTLRDYRGRGLAKLVKSAALRKAAEVGIHTAITCNDYENKPMLAVNDWLGYQVCAAEWSVLKEL
ncbi:GNAT family N-acetyltransferase [Catellatospora tritici]|uniref:GNAT family N-acetyltransferase n=1 Tax=Catellatospora tritici TaxID=2851566 RepID=UPI001C2D4D80|nr:GNAT family N-acetyltransferase [Catellatospora tritici]MBV1854239.1 GNAT family N-acetyltransferase [Catellatospora tritici]